MTEGWMPDQAGHDKRSNSKGPFLAPPGGAVPRSRPFHFRGEDCLSAASSAAHTPGTGAQAPPLGGPARAPLVLGPFAETKGPRRVGPKPHNPPPLVVRGRHPAGEKKGRAGTQARPYTQTP